MLDPARPPLKPVLPKTVTIETLANFLKGFPRAFLEVEPQEMARQITLLDAEMYGNIHSKECLDSGWEMADKLQRSPYISRMIKNTNNVCWEIHFLGNQFIFITLSRLADHVGCKLGG